MPIDTESLNYVAWARRLLFEELGEENACEDYLVDLYTLLVLTEGVFCTLEHVHDAWSVWTASSRPEHPSLIAFSRLSNEIQEYDRPYRDAIVRAAHRMHRPNGDATYRNAGLSKAPNSKASDVPRYFNRKSGELE